MWPMVWLIGCGAVEDPEPARLWVGPIRPTVAQRVRSFTRPLPDGARARLGRAEWGPRWPSSQDSGLPDWPSSRPASDAVNHGSLGYWEGDDSGPRLLRLPGDRWAVRVSSPTRWALYDPADGLISQEGTEPPERGRPVRPLGRDRRLAGLEAPWSGPFDEVVGFRSADRSLLVVHSCLGVALLDAHTGERLDADGDLHPPVTGLVLRPGGEVVVLHGDGRPVLYDGAGQPGWLARGEREALDRDVGAPSEALVAVDGAGLRWRVRDHRVCVDEVGCVLEAPDPITALAVGGDTVATGHADGTVLLWDRPSQAKLSAVERPRPDTPTVRVREHGLELHAAGQVLPLEGVPVGRAVVASETLRVAVVSEERLWLWEPGDTPPRTVPLVEVDAVAITADGRWVVTGGLQGVVLVDADAGRVDRGLASRLRYPPPFSVRITDGDRVVRSGGLSWSLPEGLPLHETAPAWPAEVEDMRLDSAGGLWVSHHGRWWRRDGHTGEVTGPEVAVMGVDWQRKVRAGVRGLSWADHAPSPVDCGAVLSRWCAEPPGPVPEDFEGFDPRQVHQVR